jgi:cytochrome c peroxidase
MAKAYRTAIIWTAVAWTAGCLAAAFTLLPWSGISASGNVRLDRQVWKEKYRRPAEIPFPSSDPYSEAKVKLGKTLFFDPVLSGSRTRSCASCHNPALSWGDGRAHAMGENETVLSLRTPTLLNVAWTPQLGWTGHFPSLEAVAFGPITSPDNMNLPEKDLLARLSAIPGYVDAFSATFGEGPITRRKIEMALASFERTIVSRDAPFDHWIEGDKNAIDQAAKRGFDLFNSKARCSSCHSDWMFSDSSFHDIGVAKGDDIGRGRLFPSSVKLQYAFKTPTLRDVARRAPYMHDGSVPTLEAVIDLYNRGGIKRPSRSVLISPLGLTDREKSDLIAFLQTLTSPPEPVSLPTLPR